MKENNFVLLWLVLFLVIFCIFVVGSIYFAVETKSKDLILAETAKAFIQLGTVGVFGALVKFTFDQISESRHKQQIDLEAKRELLKRLLKLKHVVKTVPFHIEGDRNPEAYRKGIRSLLNSYMEIRDFGNDIRHSEFIYPYKERIGIHVWMMTIFISKILEEAAKKEIESWEQIVKMPEFKQYREAVLDFNKLGDKLTPYKIDYDEHYDAIKKELRRLITGEISSKWRKTNGKILHVKSNKEDEAKPRDICQLEFEYQYSVKCKKIPAKTEFKTFEKDIFQYAFKHFHKVKKSKDKVVIYYDPVNPKISVVELPSEYIC